MINIDAKDMIPNKYYYINNKTDNSKQKGRFLRYDDNFTGRLVYFSDIKDIIKNDGTTIPSGRIFGYGCRHEFWHYFFEEKKESIIEKYIKINSNNVLKEITGDKYFLWY